MAIFLPPPPSPTRPADLKGAEKGGRRNGRTDGGGSQLGSRLAIELEVLRWQTANGENKELLSVFDKQVRQASDRRSEQAWS